MWWRDKPLNSDNSIGAQQYIGISPHPHAERTLAGVSSNSNSLAPNGKAIIQHQIHAIEHLPIVHVRSWHDNLQLLDHTSGWSCRTQDRGTSAVQHISYLQQVMFVDLKLCKRCLPLWRSDEIDRPLYNYWQWWRNVSPYSYCFQRFAIVDECIWSAIPYCVYCDGAHSGSRSFSSFEFCTALMVRL